MKYIKELKEWKNLKPYNPYGSKRIKISKIELEGICNKIGISSNSIKFLSSGSFGNAYSYDDKVMKITIDKNEAIVAHDLISKGNKRMVKYYNVYKYNSLYVIIMDRVTPILDYLDKIKNLDKNYIWDLTSFLHNNWGTISQGQYLEDVYEYYNKKTIVGIKRFLLDEIWDIYESIHEHYIDLHPDNIGIKDGRLICFDLTSVRGGKFDDPKNI